jgi:cell division septation protein DedD
MSNERPASLDGSLLARKGDAAPAIGADSPMTQHLGEPLPQAPGGAFAADGPAMLSSDDASPVRRRMVLLVGGVLLIVLAAALVAGAMSRSPSPASSGEAAPETKPAVITAAAAPETLTAPVPAMTAEPAPSAAAMPMDSATLTLVKAAEEVQAIAPAAGTPSEPPAPEPKVAALTEAPPPPPAPMAMKAPETVAPKSTPTPPAPAKPEAQSANSKPMAPKVTATPVTSGRYAIQFAAVKDAKRARVAAAQIEKRLASTLGGRKISVVKAALKDKGTVYRLRATGYRSYKDAQAACKQIAAMKITCLAVRN